MTTNYYYEELKTLEKYNNIPQEIPRFLKEGVNPKFHLRDYQIKAFARFFYHLEKKSYQERHLLFNMATGSGKTLMMAGFMLYLFQKGFENFLFFVNSTNIIEKTKDNFLNKTSNKYLLLPTSFSRYNPLRGTLVNSPKLKITIFA